MSEARDPHFIESNRRQVERLSKLGWYHSIELPDGGVIEGHQSIEQLRRRLALFPIPDDLTGKRVLDIGAWDGWFSFEMERRGAEVMALDSTRNTRLMEARRLLGSRVEYRIGDICRLTHRDLGTFDIVLFLGVLYHVKHPILALENVCGMTREMACIESFVSDTNPAALPAMEYYETTELRGQLDNWVGPNLSCLMAFARTAGFARVEDHGALGERSHLVGYRTWDSATTAPARITCVENAATHGHGFDPEADDYITFYFTTDAEGLDCDNVRPRVGPYGSRPIHVARVGGGWQATCKVPPGLAPGWYDASLSGAQAVRIAVGDAGPPPETPRGALQIARVTDGKTFEDNRVRVGEGSCVSAWVHGFTDADDVRLRLDGTDLPAIWVAPPDGPAPRQVNALLPSGLPAGVARITAAQDGAESAPIQIEFYES